ncbi:MAG TPA: hypothetical protein VGF22_14040 [Acidimicrobiales bacterium]
MSRRIELELTSARPDGTWTWRAAGAREPKGVLDGSLLPGGAKVGDVLRADADFDLEGITVTAVLPPKGARKEPERIELLGGTSSFEPVTQTLVARSDRPRRERRDGDRDRDRDRERRPRPDGDRSTRGPGRERSGRPATGERSDRGPRPDATGERPARPPRAERPPRAPRPPRPEVPELPMRPKPKRLRAVRTHRNEVLNALPPEQRPVAEQVLRGGVPAVRQAIDEQNTTLRAEGKPEVPPSGVIALAEELLPRLRVAEWQDRAEGALNDLDELDLRDLRSVVVAADDPAVARDESTRDLAARLKDALANRQDKEHQDWLADIDAALSVGRIVRALRLSSRPPKAGVRFPPDLAGRLVQATATSLTADASSDRWVAVLEALAYSPVHGAVVPTAAPAVVSDELRSTAKRLAALVPEVAKLFGIEPPAPGTRAPRPPRRPPSRKPDKARVPPPPKDEPRLVAPTETATVEPEPAETATVETEPQPEPAEPTADQTDPTD